MTYGRTLHFQIYTCAPEKKERHNYSHMIQKSKQDAKQHLENTKDHRYLLFEGIRECYLILR